MKAQGLNLYIEAEVSINSGLKDSLNITGKYKNYQLLKQAADSVPSQLQRMGFIEAELLSVDRKNDSTFVAHYFFGKKYKYIKIYYARENFSNAELSKVSSETTNNYFILPFESLEASLQKLNQYKTEKGKTFSKLRLKSIVQEDDFLSASLILDQGSTRVIDSVAIKGYEKFPKSYLKYYAGIRKGKTFSEKKINQQNDIINNLPFVTTLKAPEVLFRKDTTVVYLYLKKRNANLFDGVLGFATSETTKKLELNGYLNLELNNNLNYGEQFLINYKADGDDQRNFRVKTTLPYLLKSPFGLGLELKIFKRDSTFITTDQQARVSYQLRPSFNSYGGYKSYESSNLLDNINTGSPIEDFTSRYLIIGLDYFKPQNQVLFPKKTEITIDTEIGTRNTKNSMNNQLRFSTKLNYIFNLNYKNSIFLQNISNVLVSDSFLTNELFRFGGINSIRGFEENSIDASLFSVINTEYRYQFNQGMYLHSIFDFGYFEDESLSIKEKLYSYGIGLGLQTEAGLFKLNIANGNSENRSFNFSNTKIHLILSSRF